MKANGCVKYKLVDIMYASDYLGFTLITPTDLRKTGYDCYGYNDDYECGLIVSDFEKNMLRAKKSDRKKTIETVDSRYFFPYPFDSPVCYFDPDNDFEMIYPLNLY